MKTVRLFIAAVVLTTLSTVDAGAQGFLKRLGEKAKNAAERVIENKTERAAERITDKVTDPDTYKGDGSNQQQQQGQTGQQQQGNAPVTAPADTGQQVPATQTPQQGGTALEMTYAKNDFVPGDEIIFDDPMDAEQLGEFPSQWDLYNGSAEMASVGGKKAILFNKQANSLGNKKTRPHINAPHRSTMRVAPVIVITLICPKTYSVA